MFACVNLISCYILHQIQAIGKQMSTRTYQCECGYIYLVGECGKPMEQKVRDGMPIQSCHPKECNGSRGALREDPSGCTRSMGIETSTGPVPEGVSAVLDSVQDILVSSTQVRELNRMGSAFTSEFTTAMSLSIDILDLRVSASSVCAQQ